MFAGIAAGQRRKKFLLIEKNNKLGVKILMSGGTRCNLTQNTDARGIVEGFGPQGRFLHSALARFGPTDVVEWFERHGVATKVESTGKIFPVSDRAIDVRNALVTALTESGMGMIRTGIGVVAIKKDGTFFRVKTDRDEYLGKTVILTTGGKSYPGCGTTGDGYRWLEEMGHTIVRCVPALTPIVCPEPWVRKISGITLSDVRVGIFGVSDVSRISEKNFARLAHGECRGSILFTHFGLSGPAILNVSKQVAFRAAADVRLVLDFLPFRSREQIEQDVNSQEYQSKPVRNLFQHWFPSRMADILLEKMAINKSTRVAEISKNVRQNLVDLVKKCEILVEGTRGFKKAEVTAGGLSLQEVNSQTMESRLVKGLFVAGEILDLDGPIGGYNFQSAFSTGRLAGMNV